MRAGFISLVAGIVVGLVSTASGVAADSPAPLSWRLQELSSPELRSATPAEQGDAVSLLAHGAGSLLRDGDSLVVEVRVNGKASARTTGLRDAGAEILGVSPRYATITAAVDERELGELARAPGVEWVGEQITPMTGSVGKDDAGSGSINTCGTGVVTEGNTQLKAGAARTQFDVDGTGVKVGVLSDSFDTKATGLSASDDIATGDLPGPGNPCGRTTAVENLADAPGPQTDEGRAMLQIVHDLAPGSPLAFATAIGGQTVFADNIRALAASGAKVITDDIIYFREPMYQDGVIAKAINDVTAQGVSYFTMAFNNNGLGINSYEAVDGYRSTTCPAPVLADRAGGADSCMDFDPGAGVDNTLDVNVAAGTPFRLSLAWAEARFGVSDDFDVYAFNPNTSGTISAFGKEDNLVSQDPTEFAAFTVGGAGGRQIVIRRYAGTGTPRLKLVSNDNGANTITSLGQAITTPDVSGPTIYGHNGAETAQTLGAVPFDNSAIVEPFSSRGPVTLLFGPDNGTTAAPALGAPQVLSKPDVAATDGGINTFFGSGNRFKGTSAAAPHAAAVGALQLEANPTLTLTQVKAAQRNTAVPVGVLGPNVVGSGLIDAQAAIASAPPAAPAITVQGGTGLTSDSTPTLGFAISPADPKAVTCSIDGGAAQACSSPFTTPTLADGAHTVAIGATDYFNANGSASASVTVDTTAPNVNINKGPKKKSTKRKAKFKFSASEAGATFSCKLDKAGFKPCSSPAKFKAKPGKHKLQIEATDAAGNVGKVTYKWKVI